MEVRERWCLLVRLWLLCISGLGWAGLFVDGKEAQAGRLMVAQVRGWDERHRETEERSHPRWGRGWDSVPSNERRREGR